MGVPPIVVMGVSGSGKTTVGSLLGDSLGVPFLDGDSLHPDANRAAMAAGRPLTEAERLPWLHAVGRSLTTPGGVVVACSALRRSYRDLLREHRPDLFVVYAEGDFETISARISERQHEYMPASLLSSQFALLEPREPDERGITVSVVPPAPEIVARVRDELARQGAIDALG